MSDKCGNKSCEENWPGATAGSDEKKKNGTGLVMN